MLSKKSQLFSLLAINSILILYNNFFNYKINISKVKQSNGCDTFFNDYRKNPYLNEIFVNKFRECINGESVAELSSLVLKTGVNIPEGGGVFYAVDDRFIFHELPNLNIIKINDLINNNSYDISTINNLAETLNVDFSMGDDCIIGYSDNYWSSEISITKNLISKAKKEGYNFNDVDIIKSRIIKYFIDSYYRSNEIPNFTGIIVSNVHTHSNFTSLSSQDLCLSKKFPNLVVSHNYPKNNDTFRLYLGFNNLDYLISDYKIIK